MLSWRQRVQPNHPAELETLERQACPTAIWLICQCEGDTGQCRGPQRRSREESGGSLCKGTHRYQQDRGAGSEVALEEGYSKDLEDQRMGRLRKADN